jgi:hypothetical protein
VVEAAKKLEFILVDCNWGKQHTDVSGKYGVRGYPTVIFVDGEGTKLADLGGRDASAVAKQFEDIAAKHTKAAAWVADWQMAFTEAKDANKVVVMFFTNGKADAEALEKAIADDTLKDLREKFVFCKAEIKSDAGKKFKVSSSSQPVLLFLSPLEDKPEDKPLKKISGKKTAKELKKEMEAVVKKWEDGR